MSYSRAICRFLRIAVALAAIGPIPSVVSAGERWIVVDGTCGIRFYDHQLQQIGVQIEQPGEGHTFGVRPAESAGVDVLQGRLIGWIDDALELRGNAILRLPSGAASLQNAMLVPFPGGFQLIDHRGRTLVTLDHSHTHFDPVSGTLFCMEMDMKLSGWLAEEVGVPRHEGLLAGAADLVLSLRPPEAPSPESAESAGGGCIADFGPTVDLELTDMDSISQIAIDPGVRVAFAPSAKLRNIGAYDVRWYWAIAPAGFNGTNIGPHPFLAMHFYREQDGVFRQIGRSDLKHAWNTVNSGCPCPGGQVMYVGCSDTYGIANNGTQFYFGPREELTAHTGDWSSLGSHFDATPVDNVRNHQTIDHDSFEHRLTVAESDLVLSNSSYYVEAWYIVAGDTNIFNNMGYRRVTQEIIGGAWDFEFADAGMTQGTALNAWVDPASPDPGTMNTLVATADGHVQVAVRSTPLTNGFTRYEYALMNVDFDRRLRAFSVPLIGDVEVINVSFSDVDGAAGNDWQAVVTDDAVTWSTPAGDPSANALDWGTLFNFGFDANASPVDAPVTMGVLEAGAETNLQAGSLVPNLGADLSVSKAASWGLVTHNGTVVYSLVVSNAGPSTAAGVLIRDEWPANDAFLATVPMACADSNGILICSLGSLPAGAATQLVYSIVFTNSAPVDAVTNLALALSNTDDAAPANQEATSVVETDHDGDRMPTRFESQTEDSNGNGIPAYLDPDETFRLLDFQLGESGITGTWDAVSGAVYQLQMNPMLGPLPAAWLNVGGIVTSAGNIAATVLTNTPISNEIYRVLLEEIP